jgi:rod shape-determining protein MreC
LVFRSPSRRDQDDGVRFSRTLTATLIIISILLIIFDRPDVRPPALSAVRSTVVDVVAPLLDLAARPLRAMGNIGPYWRRQGELAQENAALRDQLNDTLYWRDLALRLRDQIEIYEQTLDLDVTASQERVGAWTLADPTGPFVQSRIIGAGAERGIRDGDPVLNVFGLVGRVVETGRRSSRVLLLTDLNSRVPVIADRTNARAILIGNNTNFPRLDYVGRDADLRDGDRIVTSGDDGVLPRGLPIGVAALDRDGQWRVRLFSDQAPVDFVWVFPHVRVLPPEADPVIEDEMEPPTGDETGTATDESIEPALTNSADDTASTTQGDTP